MNIPIKQIPGPYTAVAVTMEPSKFVIGPLPTVQRSHYILERIRDFIIDALAVLGWIIGLIIMLAALSPSFSGQLEDHISWLIVGWAEESSDLYTTK